MAERATTLPNEKRKLLDRSLSVSPNVAQLHFEPSTSSRTTRAQAQPGETVTTRHTMPLMQRGKSANDVMSASTRINEKRRVFGWGQNRDGQLSIRQIDTVDSIVTKPALVIGLSGQHWPVQIASGNTHSVAVAEAGGAYVCGSAVLGHSTAIIENTRLNQKRFQQVNAVQSMKLKQVACGDYHTLCLGEDGMVYTWGGSLNSKLFKRPSIKQSATQDVLRPLRERVIKQIACGDFHSLALEENGQLWSWGGGGQAQHNRGQLGHGNNQMLQKPSQITFFANKNVLMVAAGGYHSMAVTSEQTLYAWGDSKYGQTGTGDFVETCTPRPCVSHAPDKTRQISIASFSNVMKRKETTRLPLEDKIKQVAAGGNHSMILTESGAMYSFGYGAHGQLGTPMIANISVPQQVKSFLAPQVLGFTEGEEERIVQIALGQNHSLALSSEGFVYACGAAQFGQLGLGEAENAASFSKLHQLFDIVGVFAGGNTSWAVKDTDSFQVQQDKMIEEAKKAASCRSKAAEVHVILNSSQSPIQKDDDNGELLFQEDVDKYDSFLRKSCYLDSPPPQQANNDRVQSKRVTAAFGSALPFPKERLFEDNPRNLNTQPQVYEESSDDDLVSQSSGVNFGAMVDFNISFMKSQTEYFHRFIRLKNVDPDRQVILENAVERYLVTMEKDMFKGQRGGISMCRPSRSYSETVVYSTLQEDTVVANPMPGKKSFTLLMIVERKSVRAVSQLPILSVGSINNGQSPAMAERGENFRENQSQFSNPLSADIYGNASDMAIMQMEPGELKTLRYSQLNETQLRHGVAKWARNFQSYLSGVFYIDMESVEEGQDPETHELQVALANLSFMELQP